MSQRSLSISPITTSPIRRAKTELWTNYNKHVSADETMLLYDKDDFMNILLQEKVKENKKNVSEEEVKAIEAEIKQIHEMETDNELRNIPNHVLEDWTRRVNANPFLKKGLESGTIDERTLRKAFGIKLEESEKCGWVDSFLVCNEKVGTFHLPALASWGELLELFGNEGNISACAPEYWEEEVKKGRGERARLIKVGIDIPAIWAIDDAEQVIKADLYMTFSWKVKATRSEIWNDVSREFIHPVWKVRMRNGKLITNLKEFSILSDETSCADETDGYTKILQRITLTADFSQSFDLHRFPFDKQEISFILRYWLIPYRTGEDEKRGRLIFYEDIDWKCRVKEKALKPSDEWFIYHPITNHHDQEPEYDKLEIKSNVTPRSMDPKMGRRWPELSFSFHIERNPEFMKWNVACPITMTVLFGLVGNLTSLDSDFDRTSFTAALLFTIFSIKGNVQYALSKVGYGTTLDKYILWSQAVIIIQGVVGVLFSHQNDVEDFEDFFLPIGFGIVGLLFWVILSHRFWNGKDWFLLGKKLI